MKRARSLIVVMTICLFVVLNLTCVLASEFSQREISFPGALGWPLKADLYVPDVGEKLGPKLNEKVV